MMSIFATVAVRIKQKRAYWQGDGTLGYILSQTNDSTSTEV